MDRLEPNEEWFRLCARGTEVSIEEVASDAHQPHSERLLSQEMPTNRRGVRDEKAECSRLVL